MRKRIIALFLIVIAVFTCLFAFVACDKDDDGSSQVLTEEEIETIMGKFATYVLTKNIEAQMNFEVVPEEERAGYAEAGFGDVVWLVRCEDNHVIKMTSEDAAKEYVSGLGEAASCEQKGCFVISYSSKESFDSIMALEDRSVELLSQEFIDQYKKNLKSLINSGNSGYQSFFLADVNQVNDTPENFVTAMSRSTQRNSKTNFYSSNLIVKLFNDASEDDVKRFNAEWSGERGEKVTKINDRLYFVVE